MFKLRLPFMLACSIALVLRRRLSHGPHRPTWTWSMEIFAEMLRRLGVVVNAMPLASQAATWESLVLPDPVLKQVRFESVVAGGIPAQWVIPATPGPTVILYLHGGWYSGGSLKTYRELMARIALASSARILMVDYRLAPAHPYPAAIDDAVAVWQWLTAGHALPADVVVAGDSAGSGLSLALMLRLRDAGKPLPRSSVLICPWVDLSASGGTILEHAPFDWAEPEEVFRRVKLYIGDGDPKRPEVSAVFADLTGLPPMLIQAGGAEMLFDQEKALAERAQTGGVDVTFDVAPDMIHDWQLFAGLFPEGRAAIERIGAFVRRPAR